MALVHLTILVTNEKSPHKHGFFTRGENQLGSRLAIAPSQTLEASRIGMDPHSDAVEVPMTHTKNDPNLSDKGSRGFS